MKPERRADRQANGLDLPADLWESIASTARKVGIDDDRIAAAITN